MTGEIAASMEMVFPTRVDGYFSIFAFDFFAKCIDIDWIDLRINGHRRFSLRGHSRPGSSQILATCCWLPPTADVYSPRLRPRDLIQNKSGTRKRQYPENGNIL